MNILGKITIGQYIAKDSFLHRLDPRSKIVFDLVLITSVFLVTDFYQYAVLGGVILFMIFASKVPLSHYMRGLKALWILIALTAVFQIFSGTGGTGASGISGAGNVIFEFGFLKITNAAVNNTIFITLRLIFVILAASILTLTTSPIQLADGLEALMRMFRFPKEWAHDFSMMISIAFRFIPVLSIEAEHVMRAQLSRGARFDRGGLIQRVKGMVPLLIPLFVGAVKMADELAIAMEARCYRGAEGRTKYKQLKMKSTDYIFIVSGAILILAIVLHSYIFRAYP